MYAKRDLVLMATTLSSCVFDHVAEPSVAVVCIHYGPKVYWHPQAEVHYICSMEALRGTAVVIHRHIAHQNFARG